MSSFLSFSQAHLFLFLLLCSSSLYRFLYDESGTRFLLKGIAYQEAGTLAADSAANAANVSSIHSTFLSTFLPSLLSFLRFTLLLALLFPTRSDYDSAFLQGGYPEPNSYVDPLAEGAACARDLPHLQALGVNVVRIYSVNSSLNHDACMTAFEGAGIYTMYVRERDASRKRKAPPLSFELRVVDLR